MNEELFDDTHTISALGSGSSGTTYLCMNYKTKKIYAMKIQKFIPNDEEYGSDVKNELTFYKFINTLPSDKQCFFTKLYSYKIYNNCKYKNPHAPLIFKNTWYDKMAKASWCASYITEFAGENTMTQFLNKNRRVMSYKMFYSILLQILHIISILKENNFINTDIRAPNLIVAPTNKKYFTFKNRKIQHYGMQVISIDYGQVQLQLRAGGLSKAEGLMKAGGLMKEPKKNDYEFLNVALKIIYEITRVCYTTKIENIRNMLMNQSIPLGKFLDLCPHELLAKYLHNFPNQKKTLIFIKSGNFAKLNHANLNHFMFYIADHLEEYYPDIYNKFYPTCANRINSIPLKVYMESLDLKNIEELEDFYINAYTNA